MASDLPARPRSAGPFSTRILLAFILAALGLLAAGFLGLNPGDLFPGEGGLQVAGKFFSSAVRPALDYEVDWVPEGAPTLPIKALTATLHTALFAVAALSLSLPLGLVLGFFSSSAWRQRRGLPSRAAAQTVAGFAVSLAAFLSSLLALPASRRFSSAKPWLPGGARRARLWILPRLLSRALLILFRGLPEYVWAFLLIAMLGPSPWSLVLALALHNAGILGRFGSELTDDLDPRPLAALRGLGARRGQLAAFAIYPLTLGRFLLYFFYRWETCVRESTVLGMLGVASLGFWIVDERARGRYDEMLFFILLGILLVLLGDLVSRLVRGGLRRV